MTGFLEKNRNVKFIIVECKETPESEAIKCSEASTFVFIFHCYHQTSYLRKAHHPDRGLPPLEVVQSFFTEVHEMHTHILADSLMAVHEVENLVFL